MHQDRQNRRIAPRAAGFVLLIFFAINPAQSAANEQSGAAMPAGYQAFCTSCHAAMLSGEGDHLYRRHNRIVQDYAALLQRVYHCSQGAGTGWDAKRLREVVDYLNQRYYRFSASAP